MLLRILRFLRGYVRFSVQGRYPERFLNITAKRGIRLFDVVRSEKLTACMFMSDYRCIRSAARGAGVRLSVISRHGLPCLVRCYRSRVGVMIGAFAFLLTVFIMSQFVWSIDITGLDTVSRSEMLSILRDNGLYVGAFLPSVDDGEISRSVLINKKEIGWMAVNINGSYVSVELKEEALPPDVDDISVPCNIKASRDGLILRVVAENGKKVIPEGSGVIKGQLIVSGIMGGKEQKPATPVSADALVWARTTRRASFSVPETVTGFMPTGEIAKRRSVKLLGLTVPYSLASVSTPDSFIISFEEAPAPLNVRLPLSSIEENVLSLEKYEKKLDEASARELLERQSRLYESFSLSACAVTDRNYELIHKDGRYTLRVTYTCEEDIASREPIGVQADETE